MARPEQAPAGKFENAISTGVGNSGVSPRRWILSFVFAWFVAQVVGTILGLVRGVQVTRDAFGDVVREDPWIPGFLLATGTLTLLLAIVQTRQPSRSYLGSATMGFVCAAAVWFGDRFIFIAALTLDPVELLVSAAFGTLIGVGGGLALHFAWNVRRRKRPIQPQSAV